MSCIFIVTVYFQVNENVTVLVPFQLTEVHDQTISEVFRNILPVYDLPFQVVKEKCLSGKSYPFRLRSSSVLAPCDAQNGNDNSLTRCARLWENRSNRVGKAPMSGETNLSGD